MLINYKDNNKYNKSGNKRVLYEHILNSVEERTEENKRRKRVEH